MAGVNIGNVGLTFIRYLSGVVSTMNNESKLRQRIGREDRWKGAYIEGRVHVGRTNAVGYIEDGGAFPVADKQDYVSYTAYRKFLSGSVQLTDGVMATASGSENVARDVVTSEVKGLMTDLMKLENGMMLRDGTGVCATISGTGLTSANATDVTVDDARLLWDGAYYDVYDAARTTKRGTVTVSSVVSAPNASGQALVNFSNAAIATQVNTDVLVLKGSVNRAITGLDALINDSGTFQNVNCATYPRYTSLVMDNSGTPQDLTPTLFRQMLAGLMQKCGNQTPSKGLSVYTSSWQSINIEELYEGELRLRPTDTSGGLAVASFVSTLGKINIENDVDCPYGTIFFADMSQIKRGVQKDLAWRRQGGQIFQRSDVSSVWTATALEICELYIKDRFSSGKITNLNQDPSTMY